MLLFWVFVVVVVALREYCMCGWRCVVVEHWVSPADHIDNHVVVHSVQVGNVPRRV